MHEELIRWALLVGCTCIVACDFGYVEVKSGDLVDGGDQDDPDAGPSGAGGAPPVDAGTGDMVWGLTFGSDGIDSGFAIDADADMSVVVAGRLADDAEIAGVMVPVAIDDVFVTKIAQDGSVLWRAAFGDDEPQKADAVAFDADGDVFVAGEYAGSPAFGTTTLPAAASTQGFVAHLDGSDGSVNTAVALGGASAEVRAHALAVVPDGTLVVVGEASGTGIDFAGSSPLDALGTDAFVVWLDGSRWISGGLLTGDDQAQSATDVAVDENGTVYVVGTFAGTMNVGSTSLSADGGLDAFVAVYPAGASPFAWSIGGQGDQRASAVTVTPSGVVVGGEFERELVFAGEPILSSSGGTDAFALAIDESGTATWARRAGGAAHDATTDLSAHPEGSVVVTGTFDTELDLGEPITSAGNDDMFIAKLGADGGPLWSHGFGRNDTDMALASVVDAAGDAIVTGSFMDKVSFGDTPHRAVGACDVFVVKLTR